MAAPTMLTLLIGDRERFVAPHVIKSDTPHRVLRLVIGDFAIIDQGGRIIALFERKTYADYAASIKDGRHGNKQNLIDERARTGCDVYYVVEGDLDSLMRYRTIEGIPAIALTNSITNLMVRDRIFVIDTCGPDHTARRLMDFVKSYEKHYYTATRGDATVGGGAESTAEVAMPVAAVNIPKSLTVKKQRSDAVIKKDMMLSIPFITEKNYDILAPFTIADLCHKNILEGGDVGGIKVTERVKRNLHVGREQLVKMLVKVPMISPRIAADLVNLCSLDVILTGSIPESASTSIVGLHGALIKKINALMRS